LCQATPDNVQVCWVADPNLTPIRTGVWISSTTVTSGSSNDGALHLGDSYSIKIYATNTGKDVVNGLWATATSSGPDADFFGCTIGYGSNMDPTQFGGTEDCGQNCYCTVAALNGDVTSLSPGQASKWPILTLSGETGGVAPVVPSDMPLGPVTFTVVFTDARNQTWTDSFQVEVRQ
jgi:hypothetical protein